MKERIFRRVFMFILTAAILLQTSGIAMAAETDTVVYENQETTITTRAIGSGATGYLPAKGTLTLYPTLTTSRAKMYFWFWASPLGSSTPSGKVTYKVYDPNGDYLFKRTVSVGVDQVDVYAFPSTGTYRVEITSGVSEKVFISATWSLQSY